MPWMAPGPWAEGWSAGPGPSGGCTGPWMAPGPQAEGWGEVLALFSVSWAILDELLVLSELRFIPV